MWSAFLQFHKKLLETNSENAVLARKEYILNVLLVGSIYLTGIALAVNVYNQLIYINVLNRTFTGANPLLILIVFICFGSLLILNKKGLINLSANAFIFILWLPAAYATFRWGSMLSQSLLIFALIIVLSGILLNNAATFLVTLITSFYLLITTYLHEVKLINFDESWRTRTADISSVIVIAFTFVVIALVSWLYMMRMKKAEDELVQERDSLEQRVAERTRQLREAQVEQMSQWYRFVEVGRMASEIFHDIRNPLTTASLNLEEIRSSMHDKQLTVPATAAWDSIQLITRFVEANQRQVQKQDTVELFSPAQEITLALQALQAKAKKRQVTLKTKLVDIKLHGNPLKFYQIVINLISNAIDSYLSKNHKNKYVFISTEVKNSNMVLTVSDKGSGIAPNTQSRIFDALFTTKSTADGTGLGLTVTKAAVENDFGGTISFYSHPKQGTTFTVNFPSKSHA
jgi:signal transduction histidine kinase